jgi:membrane-bound lytic murein transglycosylase D
MAPDSRLWRRWLGENVNGCGRVAFVVAIPVFLLVSFIVAPKVQARTEPKKDFKDEFATRALSGERPNVEELFLVPLPPPSEYLPAVSPSGPMRERIQIPIPKKPLIQKYIRYYQEQERESLNDMMERSRSLVPLMAEILQSNGVPAEMIAVVFIESRFEQKASFKGAGGYWQLLASTARNMGLKVDRRSDERRDLVKSTEAAARYLRELYEQYDCWLLALAAYNAGEGPVSRAMRKHHSKDFWEIAGRGGLPAKTRVYVPKVLAAMEIMKNPDTYGFDRAQYLSRRDPGPKLALSSLR